VHHRTFFDLGAPGAGRTADVIGHLFDHQLDVGATALIREDAHVFEPDQGGKDLTRVDEDEA
jgi:hypothetical protein